MFTCTTLHHFLLEWQKNTGVPPQASKVTFNAGKLDQSNYSNYMNDCGTNTPCCATMGCKDQFAPGIDDLYTFFINA